MVPSAKWSGTAFCHHSPPIRPSLDPFLLHIFSAEYKLPGNILYFKVLAYHIFFLQAISVCLVVICQLIKQFLLSIVDHICLSLDLIELWQGWCDCLSWCYCFNWLLIELLPIHDKGEGSLFVLPVIGSSLSCTTSLDSYKSPRCTLLVNLRKNTSIFREENWPPYIMFQKVTLIRLGQYFIEKVLEVSETG